MPTITQTGIIQSITPLGNGKFRISLEEDSYPIVSQNPASGEVLSGTVNSSQVLLDPYINIPNLAYSDFNAVLNNDLTPRESKIFYDLDYSTNAIQAVNYQTVITASQQSGSLPKAPVQDFNYYSKRSTLPRYEGSRNTVDSFNSGSGLNSQYSVGTYVAYYSRLIATGGGPYTGTMIIEYLIAPDGTLIEAINDEQTLDLLTQNFVDNQFEEGQIQMVATPFSSSDTVKIEFTDQLKAQSRAKLQLIGKRTSSTYVNDNNGGIVYPAGIELTTVADLPQTARQILSDNRII